MNIRIPYRILACSLVVGLLLLAGCQDEVEIPDGAFDEQMIDLRGEWRISRVFRNDENVTELFDFSRLRLRLDMDASGPAGFVLDPAGAPFMVQENGTWSLDDKIYPTALIFAAGGDSETVFFASPPVSTGNSFSIRFSLGCNDNSYTYEFTKP